MKNIKASIKIGNEYRNDISIFISAVACLSSPSIYDYGMDTDMVVTSDSDLVHPSFRGLPYSATQKTHYAGHPERVTVRCGATAVNY